MACVKQRLSEKGLIFGRHRRVGFSTKGSLTARANAAEGDPAKGLELAFRLREVELE